MPGNIYGPFDISRDIEWTELLEEFVVRQQRIVESLIDQSMNPVLDVNVRRSLLEQAKLRLSFVDRTLGTDIVKEAQIPD